MRIRPVVLLDGPQVPDLAGTWYTLKQDAPTTETAGFGFKTWKSGGSWLRWAAVWWFAEYGTNDSRPFYSTWLIGATAGIEYISAEAVFKTDSALGITWSNLGMTSSTWNPANALSRSAQNQNQPIGPHSHTISMNRLGGIVFYPYQFSVAGTGPYTCSAITLQDSGYHAAPSGAYL